MGRDCGFDWGLEAGGDLQEAEHRVPPQREALPPSVLYAIAAPVGGHGLGTTAAESLRGLAEAGLDFRVVAFRREERAPSGGRWRGLGWHPVRLLRGLVGPGASMAARKHVVAARAARWLCAERAALFHGWSGEAYAPLVEARRLGVPTVLDIPTWHRDKGRVKPFVTRGERGVGESLWRVSRQQVLTEYALADLLLVQSRAAARSFLDSGVEEKKIFLLGRGVDVHRFQPSTYPEDVFRVVFLGTLNRRKGVDVLLEVWKRLGLRNAELVLVGSVDPSLAAMLREAPASVRAVGFVAKPEEYLSRASAFVLPSALEGAAKAVYEAAACALPLVATEESGDVVADGENGVVIPARNAEALADALCLLHRNPELVRRWGAASRRRVVERFTWDHHRTRLLHAYARAMGREEPGHGTLRD